MDFSPTPAIWPANARLQGLEGEFYYDFCNGLRKNMRHGRRPPPATQPEQHHSSSGAKQILRSVNQNVHSSSNSELLVSLLGLVCHKSNLSFYPLSQSNSKFAPENFEWLIQRNPFRFRFRPHSFQGLKRAVTFRDLLATLKGLMLPISPTFAPLSC